MLASGPQILRLAENHGIMAGCTRPHNPSKALIGVPDCLPIFILDHLTIFG
jgi:hypothetical protein